MEHLAYSRSRELLASQPALAERCYAAGVRALAEGDLDSGARLFLLLALLEPRSERSWVGLGLAHERGRRTPIAAAVYTIGQRLCGGGSAWLEFGRARTLRALGQKKAAELAFDSAETKAGGTHLARIIEEHRCLL